MSESTPLTADAASFGFVLNPFHYSGELPIKIFPGATFDRADERQRQRIEAFRDMQGYAGRSLAFLHEPILKELRDSSAWDHIIPPRTTFWVINFDPRISGDLIFDFAHATQLTDAELEIGVIFPPKTAGLAQIENPWRVHSFFSSHWRYDAQHFEPTDLARSVELLGQINELCTSAADHEISRVIVRVFRDFIDLSREHRDGRVALLGYFGLIEALIVRNEVESPRSLTHQFRTKIPLLMRRFERSLPLHEVFDLRDASEAWRLLYKVRSNYAHGGDVDFGQGVFAPLRNAKVVFKFVRETLKRLLVLALREPMLVADLREC